jgi:hypothetical protein
MAANTTDPKTISDALVSLFATALVGTGLPAQSVIDYWTADLKGQGPVVMVLGAGDDPQMTHANADSVDTWFYVEVQTWVPYSHEGWTPATAEAARTSIKKIIKDTVLDHRGKARDAAVLWDLLTFAGRSTTQDVNDEGGIPYLVESTPLKAHLVHG